MRTWTIHVWTENVANNTHSHIAPKSRISTQAALEIDTFVCSAAFMHYYDCYCSVLESISGSNRKIVTFYLFFFSVSPFWSFVSSSTLSSIVECAHTNSISVYFDLSFRCCVPHFRAYDDQNRSEHKSAYICEMESERHGKVKRE